jgi:hypothetical protein
MKKELGPDFKFNFDEKINPVNLEGGVSAIA